MRDTGKPLYPTTEKPGKWNQAFYIILLIFTVIVLVMFFNSSPVSKGPADVLALPGATAVNMLEQAPEPSTSQPAATAATSRAFGEKTVDFAIVIVIAGLVFQLVYSNRRLRKESDKSKMALFALEESEARFESAFNQAFIGMGICATDGRWLEVNMAFCNLLGYARQELVGMHYTQHTHPGDFDMDREYEQKLTRGEIRTFNYEKRFIHKSGRIVWVFVSGCLVRNAEQKPLYYVAEIQDVTQRKLTEGALSDSEYRFRSMVEAANDAIICADNDGNIVLWNKGAENTFGYTEAEVLNKSLTLIIPEEYRSAHTKAVRRMQTGAKPRLMGKTLDLSGLRRDGSRFPLELSLSMWQNEGMNYYTGIIRDISERKRFEDELVSMQAVFENAMEGIAQLDKGGNFISVNHAFGKMSGDEPHELIGKHWGEILHPDDRVQMMKRFRQLFSGKKLEMEARGMKRNGTPFFFSLVMVKQFNIAGKFTGYYAFIRDITYRKISEEALIASEHRFRSVVETASDAIISADEDGNITLWNRWAEFLFGYEEEEVIGRPLTLIIPKRFHGAHLAGIQRLREGGVPRILGQTLELSGVRKNGEEFPLQLSLSSWQYNGKRYYNGIIRDIANRKNIKTLEAPTAMEIQQAPNPSATVDIARGSHED